MNGIPLAERQLRLLAVLDQEQRMKYPTTSARVGIHRAISKADLGERGDSMNN